MSEKELRKIVGLRIRMQRHLLGITQQELGERAGVSKCTVAGIEQFRKNIQLSTIARLATAMEIAPSILLTEVTLK